MLSVKGVTFREKAKVASYQLRDVSQILYTQWKHNRQEESAHIKWEELK